MVRETACSGILGSHNLTVNKDDIMRKHNKLWLKNLRGWAAGLLAASSPFAIGSVQAAESYFLNDNQPAPTVAEAPEAAPAPAACSCEEEEEECSCPCYLFGPEEPWTLTKENCMGIKIAGWTQIGYHSSNDGVFNTRPGKFDLQQQYIYAEKVADGSCGLGFGGRVDLMYGTDAQNTQAFGNNPGNFDFQNGWDHGAYGFAMPQVYGEVAYDKLSVKIGHFYTLLGYQVVPATGNFFYSIPYTFNFSEAFTHTGALATYKANDEVTLYGGWTLGWDTGFDQVNQGNSFIGGASVVLTEKLTATYITTFGNLGWIGDDGFSQSLVLDWKINDKWEYVFQSDAIGVDNSINAGGGHYDTVGINQYLFYTINDCWRAGTRVEWWKADGNSVNEMAFGVNYKPHANIVLRPEVRYNWAPGPLPGVLPVAGTAVEDFKDNTIFGMDMILTF
jgi:hypothetical protein